MPVSIAFGLGLDFNMCIGKVFFFVLFWGLVLLASL